MFLKITKKNETKSKYNHQTILVSVTPIVAIFQIAGSWRLVFGVASIVLLITAAVFLALGKGSPQPWIPSVARPRSHDVIYEQDVLELDYEDVGVQTEPYDPYGPENDEEEKDEEELKEASSVHSTISVINE